MSWSREIGITRHLDERVRVEGIYVSDLEYVPGFSYSEYYPTLKEKIEITSGEKGTHENRYRLNANPLWITGLFEFHYDIQSQESISDYIEKFLREFEDRITCR